ncbi:MAG: glycoside hydrolase family 3 N-terminal domain-containing protein, partial [Candidatus Cloacimonadales bacterium]|nr:glycoside hydrolase family 3 N-terminal domain-containing protein [Candidatus Cloacimonadales bacterium]
FDGVVITDDLQMCAIWKYYTLEEIVLNAIKAGNDLLIFSQYFAPDTSLVDKVTEIIRVAIADKKISEQRIDESFKRIIKLKNSINCPAFHKEDKS